MSIESMHQGAVAQARSGQTLLELRREVEISDLWTPTDSVFNRLTIPLSGFVDPVAFRPDYFKGHLSRNPVGYRITGDYLGYIRGERASVGSVQKITRTAGGIERSMPLIVGNVAASFLSGKMFDGMRVSTFRNEDLPDFQREVAMSAALQATFDAVIALKAEREFARAERIARSGMIGLGKQTRPDKRQLNHAADVAYVNYLAAAHARNKSSTSFEELSERWGI